MADRVQGVWTEAGKPGRPKIAALTYFNLSEDADASALAYLSDYYGDWGPRIAQYAPRTPDQLRETAKRFEDAGVDELFVDPTLADLAEIDRAAEALL
jgi:hypothetical protein